MSKYNERKLSLIWDKRKKDFIAKYPRRCDGALIANKLVGDCLLFDLDKALADIKLCFKVENLKEELEKRGYDLTTIKFSIELKDEI